MAKKYREWTPFQSYLLPPSPRDWLPDDHLAYFILDVVSELDLSEIEGPIHDKDARGERPYHPRMMVAVLLYAYCTGVYSSRKIERATHEDVAFRVVAGDSHPHFTRINEFRRIHRAAFVDLFVQVLGLCRRAGLVKLGHVAIDGTKVHANASKHKAMSYERMTKREQRLKEEVKALLGRAEQTDEQEDARYGPGKREWELPEELRHREDRLRRIRQAKAEMEEEARKQRAKDLRRQAEGMRRTAQSDPRPSMRKRQRTKAAIKEAQADALSPKDDGFDDDDDSGGTTATELPLKTTSATPEAKPKPSSQRNFTDPDSSLMMGRNGFIQAYNCQAAADDEHQVILACGVTNQPPDNGNLMPMLHRVAKNCGGAPTQATADSGYWHPAVPQEAQALGTKVLVATERLRHGAPPNPPDGKPPPDDTAARERMRFQIRSGDGRRTYAKRKTVIEPVFGQIKQARGFRRFSFRGLAAVEAEWSLVCLCHNLIKLFRASWQPVGAC